MKVIFLDIDGVLNNWYHPELINLDNLFVLKKIIKLTNAKIVIISSNKYTYQRLGLKNYQGSYFAKYMDILNREDIEIFDVTPYIGENQSDLKEKEIKKYLESNPLITDFVIIDDEIVSKFFKKEQVRTLYTTGLEDSNINEVIDILNGNLGFYPKNYNIKETSEQKLIRINRHHNQNNH